jgi:hypothetical protein
MGNMMMMMTSSSAPNSCTYSVKVSLNKHTMWDTHQGHARYLASRREFITPPDCGDRWQLDEHYLSAGKMLIIDGLIATMQDSGDGSR